MEKRKGKIMGLLREFLNYKNSVDGIQSSNNETLRTYLYLTKIRTGKDISDELLDELASLRFDITKETSKEIFNTINSSRYAVIAKKIVDENLEFTTLRVTTSNQNKYISMLGDILEIGTFVGVKDDNTKKVKLAKGIFYAK